MKIEKFQLTGILAKKVECTCLHRTAISLLISLPNKCACVIHLMVISPK